MGQLDLISEQVVSKVSKKKENSPFSIYNILFPYYFRFIFARSTRGTVFPVNIVGLTKHMFAFEKNLEKTWEHYPLDNDP